MFMPFGTNVNGEPNMPDSTVRRRAGMPKTMSVDSGIPAFNGVDEDNFTMVVLPSNPQSAQTGPVSPQKQPTPQPSTPQLGTPHLGSLPADEQDIFNSPVQRLRTPMIRSPLRSPIALAAGDERDATAGASNDIVIHEDSAPSAGHRSPPNLPDDKPVLEELPLNERAPEPPRDGSPSRRGLKTPSQSYLNGGEQNGVANGFTNADSGVDRAETQRSRKLLKSGLNSIRARTLEAHGFRRVQEIVRSNADVWGEGPEHAKYGELLVALLEHLEAPPQSFKCPPAKVVGLKAQ
ncbi:hypothetical protein LTS18_001801, partial [Coniosporium uncinatum]